MAANVEGLKKSFGAAFTTKRLENWGHLVNGSYTGTVVMNFD